MSHVSDPYTGLQLIELSHPWSFGVPSNPGQEDVQMIRGVKHAQHGVLAWKIKTVLHTGTHMNAPLHMIQRGKDISELPEDRFFGNGVVLDIPKNSFDVITAKDLKAAGSKIVEGDIIVIVTGWHHKYADSFEYYGESPGLTRDAAEWLANLKCKLVAVDTPQIDHPLATSFGPHRGGPIINRLEEKYRTATGLDPKSEHGEWNVAHKTLLAAEIPTIEQVGGDIDLLLDKRATFVATPWKFRNGDACPIRFIAMLDPMGKMHIDSGENESSDKGE